MALSQSVSDSLETAQGQIRNALAFAARHERPVTCSAIADLLQRLEAISSVEDIMEKIENHLPDLDI